MTTFINDNGESINYTGEFLITKQVANFRDFKIKGDVSITFAVPNTSDNRRALGYYGMNQLDGPIFSTNSFNLVKNGNTLMRGNLVIESDTGKEINLYFISGNANWFRLLDFSCKDVRNDGYQVRWTWYWINFTKSNKKGIIFPLIDYTFQRLKFDKYNMITGITGLETSDVLELTNISKINNFPCLYINTLIDEIAIHAGIKITGNLLDEQLYQSLIITPEGPDLYNENGPIDPFYANLNSADASGGAGFTINNMIRIQDIAPNIKAIEIIKWLCITFGCVPVYDEYSKTLTLNLVEKYDKLAAEDWSKYIQSYVIRFNQSDNNYIRVPEAPEKEIEDYNRNNPDALFGELNIQTGKDDGSSTDLYTSLFAPVMDNIGTTPLNWATPFIEFYKLEDDEPIEYTSVSSSEGRTIFSGAVNLGNSPSDGFIFRVVDDNGLYDGYHVGSFSDIQMVSRCDFISDSTGIIYPQRITKVNAGPRVLVCIPNYNVNNFTSQNGLIAFGTEEITSFAYAYFHKPFFPYHNLNAYKTGLSYGQLDFDANDITNPPPITPPTTYTVTYAITAELSVPNAAKFYYRVNGGSWTLMKSTTVPVYPSYTTLSADAITVNENDTVQIGVLNSSDANIEFGVTAGPSNTYTGYCGQDTDTQFTVTSSITKYINIKCTSGSPNSFTTC